eukprot:TRINITY_DN8925_c0_g1_i1.p1 TRINITY_DN8925_c0_g1~~TRINITY_DN8925_c0_g1_i1.p1  ORF type:complete len:399 (+),score=61.65 TRINITY_DN8925_c0_g1_i1:39-1199(+)
MLRALTAWLTLTVAVHCCSTDTDCSLNGLCTNGSCVCDAAWSGGDCGVLRLLPTPKANGIRNSTSTWGGSAHHDAASGKWYMFASEFINDCGLNNWSPNSRVIRTVSTTGPLGPYAFDGEVLPTFHHNPQVRRTSNGSYVMYVIGRDCNKTSDCTNGPSPAPVTTPCPIPGDMGPPNMESGITAYFAQTLTSPWTEIGQVLGSNAKEDWDADTTNPGPYLHPNGSVLLMYRGCGYYCSGGEKIGLAVADSYTSVSYERLNKAHSLCDTCYNEDPYVWQDTRGNYHALLHNLGPNGGFDCHEAGGEYRSCDMGTHAFSSDGFSWTFSKTVPFNTTVAWSDGSSVVLHRRERPQLIVENGAPQYLINGVQYFNDGDRSATLIVPVNTQ